MKEKSDMSNLVPQTGGYSLVVNWPAMHRRIMFRHAPEPGSVSKTEIVQMKGRDPLGCAQVSNPPGATCNQ
jgi:hypothetical protein